MYIILQFYNQCIFIVFEDPGHDEVVCLGTIVERSS